MTRIRSLLIPLAGILVFGCSDDEPATVPGNIPTVSGVAVSSDPRNALSTVVSFAWSGAESARVVYGESGGHTGATPYQALEAGTPGRIVTLGLRPLTTYAHAVEIKGEGGDARSDSVTHLTGDLPAYLKNEVVIDFVVPPAEPDDAFLMTAFRESPTERYCLIFDLEGRIVWYRQFTPLGSYFQQSRNGNYVVFLGTTTGDDPTFGSFLEFRPDGIELRTYHAPPPFYTDNHDIIEGGGDDKVHLLSYDIREMDLSAYGGAPDARVAGHQILRLGATGQAEFMWNAWDHFGIENWIVGTPKSQCIQCDFDHPNSLALDGDGDYILSIRNFSEVTRIDSRTGDILWRMGGVSNQFTFINDPDSGFSAQHSVVPLPTGNLLVYDNGTQHSPRESRAVEYAVDEGAMTATLVWEYRHVPSIYTGILGSVQRLENGNTVVGFGNAGVFTEISPTGEIVWEAALEASGRPAIRLYRCRKIASLYEYRPI